VAAAQSRPLLPELWTVGTAGQCWRPSQGANDASAGRGHPVGIAFLGCRLHAGFGGWAVVWPAAVTRILLAGCFFPCLVDELPSRRVQLGNVACGGGQRCRAFVSWPAALQRCGNGAIR